MQWQKITYLNGYGKNQVHYDELNSTGHVSTKIACQTSELISTWETSSFHNTDSKSVLQHKGHRCIVEYRVKMNEHVLQHLNISDTVQMVSILWNLYLENHWTPHRKFVAPCWPNYRQNKGTSWSLLKTEERGWPRTKVLMLWIYFY